MAPAGGGGTSFFPAGFEPRARMTLFLTDDNAWFDFLGAAQLTIVFRVNAVILEQHER